MRKSRIGKIKMRIQPRQKMRLTFLLRKVLFALILIAMTLTLINLFKSDDVIAIKDANKKEKAKKNITPVNPQSYQPIENSKRQTEMEPEPNPNHPTTMFRVGYVDLTNTGVMYISSGTTLASEGSVITSATGNTENNGNLYIKGDFTNNGTFTKDNGKVIFWDLDDQLINGSNATSFYNVEVNKSPGKVTLSLNTDISNNLNLINGKIDLNSKTLTISNSATSAISYTNGYLKSELTNNSSKVQWNIGSTTGAHTIPFGTVSDVLIPLTLNLTAGTIGNVTASTYPTAPNNTPYPTTPDSVHQMRDSLFNDNSANVVDRFWQINKTGGSGTLTVTFTYGPGEEPANGENGLVAQLYNTSLKGWIAPLSSQSANTTNNTVTTPGVSNYGPFALSKNSSTLPIELLSFTAKVNTEKQVDINWSTAAEINNDYFTVQRSIDLVNIEDLEKINGAGNSSQKKYYHTVDKDPYPGDSYYRLKQTDYDGKVKYYDWRNVTINENAKKKDLIVDNVYPNPFKDEIKIDYSIVKSGDVNIQMINEAGQVIFYDKVQSTSGSNSYVYSDNRELSDGIYYIMLVYGEFSNTIKVVKKH
jgi:hypothetical protein